MKKRYLLVISKTAVFLILVFLVFGFVSCRIGRPLYPKEWSPIVKNPSLELFSGSYNNLLMQVLESQTYDKNNLNNCLNDFWITDSLEVNLRMKCNGDLLSRPSFSLVVSHNRLVVKKHKDGILIGYRPDPSGGDVLVGPKGRYAILSIAQDGSLIVKKGDWGYGLVLFLIPVGYDNYVWYRFIGNEVEISDGKK